MNGTKINLMALKGNPTIEGTGGHLHRVFRYNELPRFDPFLMLDDFRSNNPGHFFKGFPRHLHRSIETITYVLKGDVGHVDSLGNKGIISAVDVQWGTADSGIIHREMPKGDALGSMHGFQLWANLPASQKMIKPLYGRITADQIPEVVNSISTDIRCHTGVSNFFHFIFVLVYSKISIVFRHTHFQSKLNAASEEQ